MRLDRLKPFLVMDILKKASHYPDTIHFEIGQPDLPPSPRVLTALEDALTAGKFSYTPSEGIESLRKKIAHYYQEKDISISWKNIFLTPGSSGALLLAYALALEVGERVGISDPGYPSYKNFAYTLGIEPYPIHVDATTDYTITPNHLQSCSIHALQIANPANPTGTIYENERLQELIAYCKKREITLIIDELYHGLAYEEEPKSALYYDKDLFVVSGFSKYFCMPGLRLGWIVVPDRYREKARMLCQNLFIAPPTLSQYGALEAFDQPYLAQVRATFKKRRDYLYEALHEIFSIPSFPKGAFYIWADASRYSDDATSLCKDLLEKAHVAVTPGVDFGDHKTSTFLRFSYTNSIEKMQEGVKRIKRLLLE